jgi:hypothetical protein
MNKIQKRLSKLSPNHTNALVLGTGFGILDKVIEIYDTVFVVSAEAPSIKARNLVYKENLTRLDHIPDLATIIMGLDELDNLPNIEPIWRKNNAKLFIEGGERIDKNIAKPLYDSGWACTSLQGAFHVWEKYR